MLASDVVGVLESVHVLKHKATPNGIEFSVYFERSNLPRTGWVHFRIECGSGIAGRGDAWNVIELPAGPTLGPKVRSARMLKQQVLAAMAEGIKPESRPGFKVYARWHTYGLTSSVQWFTRRMANAPGQRKPRARRSR
jgi:hypothetical protein